ncbi:MAG TPA: MGMT family protein [Candidatus Moranbacteria bacterium]|nr:MGMT family protein [Candidatus Moranbacteria bacterium]
MRNYSKTARLASTNGYCRESRLGGRPGKPAYRTPASFMEKVFAVVRKIPKGKTLSYKRVAELAGYPKAFRAVGNILNKNHNPKIPCHRVIRSDGKFGGYNRGAGQKEKILKKEGAIK